MAWSASEYLAGIIQAVEEFGGRFAEPPTIMVGREDEDGVVDGTASFGDGSRLALSVFLETSGATVIWHKYRFHYMNTRSECLFRYDNAPHHPRTVTFPHHKHEGADEQIVESGPVTLDDVLSEIRRLLSAR